MLGLVLAAPATPASADSVGISPATIRFDDALRGGEFRASIKVFTSSDTTSVFRFEKEGDAAPWLTMFDATAASEAPVDSVLAPPKGTDGVLGIKLAVPDETPNGSYSAIVTVYSDVNKDDKTSGAVNVGAQVRVEVDVTGTQSLSAELLEAGTAVSQVEVGQPVRFTAQIRNTGNVDVRPDVSVTLAGAGAEPTLTTGDPIRPGDTAVVNVSLPTKQLDTGGYTATVRATAGSLVIGERGVAFTLVPEGTLTRSGELRALTVAGPVSVGGATKVVAEFANTGQVDASASFEGELWRDGTLVGQLTSSAPLLVDPGQTASLSVIVPTPDMGTYRVTGLVNYSGKQTETKEVTLVAGSDRPESGIGSWVFALAMVAALGVIGGGVAFSRRKRRSNPSPTSP